MQTADFLRAIQPLVFATLGGLFFLLLVAWIALRQPGLGDEDKKTVRRVRAIAVLVLLAVFVWQVGSTASVNMTPRAVIDRSDVNEQNKKFEEAHQAQ